MKLRSVLEVGMLCGVALLVTSCDRGARHASEVQKKKVALQLVVPKGKHQKKSQKRKGKNLFTSKKLASKKGPQSKAPRVTVADVQKKTEEAVAAAKTFTAQTEKEYQDKIDGQLVKFNEQLDTLRARADELSKKAKAQIAMEIRAIGSKMEGAARQLESFDVENEKLLTSLTKEFDQMIAQLESEIPTKTH